MLIEFSFTNGINGIFSFLSKYNLGKITLRSLGGGVHLMFSIFTKFFFLPFILLFGHILGNFIDFNGRLVFLLKNMKVE